jgi:hypothetical protein
MYKIRYILNLMSSEFPIAIVEEGCVAVFNYGSSDQNNITIELCRNRQAVTKILETFDDPCKDKHLILAKTGCRLCE